MSYQLIKQIRDDDGLRRSFMELAKRTFDISFEAWHGEGFWSDKYIPYAIVKDGAVVSNASVNVMDFKLCGQEKRCVQIGTVMTDEAFRGQGLSKRLIETIIADWREKCDCIYLFANGTVLDFYPKFGFIRADEYEYSFCPHTEENYVNFRKLCMTCGEDRAILERCYKMSNPFSALTVKDNFGLLMFYALGPMKEHLYYSEKAKAVCVGVMEKRTWYCFDIFGGVGFSAKQLMIPDKAVEAAQKVVLGFTPVQTDGFDCQKIDGKLNDEFLFIYKDKENLPKEKALMFPVLSHA